MANILCSKCQQQVDTENISICPDCGNILCSDCAKSNSHLCNGCYEHLNYLN